MRELLKRLSEAQDWRPVRLDKLGVSVGKAPDFETLLRSDISDLSSTKEPVYIVADIKLVPKDDSKPNEFKASGSLVRLAGYFAEHSPRMKEIHYKVITITRDRNVARKQAEEV